VRLMFYGDSPSVASSYGMISYYLGKALMKKGVEVAWMALQYGTGGAIPFEGGKIYAGDVYSIEDGLRDFKPDILLHIRDNWVFTPEFYQGAYSFKALWDKYGFKQINYTPVQAIPLPDAFINSVREQAHLTLVTTKWARDYLLSEGIDEGKLDYLYHGVDFSVFYNKPTPNLTDDTKRFMFVGANYDYRKNIPFLLAAFKRYKEISGDEKAQLYIHANIIGYYHLPTFIKALKFKPDEVMFKQVQQFRNFGVGMPHKSLADLYNWANVYITATHSEGFDIPVLEAMAVGLPAIMTDFPVHREVFERFDRAYFIKSRQDYATVWGFEWSPDLDDAVELMLKVPAGKKNRDSALFKDFNWGNIADRFLKIVSDKLNI